MPLPGAAEKAGKVKRLAVVATVLGLLISASPAAAVDPGPVHQCGTFVSYRAADSTQSGQLVIGSTTYATSSGNPSPFRQVIDPRATIGSQVCLDGTVVASQTTPNLLTDFTVSPAPPCTSSVGPGIPPPTAVPSARWYSTSTHPCCARSAVGIGQDARATALRAHTPALVRP